MRVALAFASLSLSLLACRSGGGGEQAPANAAAPTSPRSDARASEPEPSAGSTAGPSPTPVASPDHGERVADLDMLCAALDHDYVDGTLSDYYAKLEPRTEWGRARLREGEESITPGRLLQQAATSIAADLDSPGLARCKKLFDVIDELE